MQLIQYIEQIDLHKRKVKCVFILLLFGVYIGLYVTPNFHYRLYILSQTKCVCLHESCN